MTRKKAPTKPISVLYWCEPHPLRNEYTHHDAIANMLFPPLHKVAETGEILMRVFSNNKVIDRILANNPETAATLRRPTNEETQAIDRLFARWEDKAIQTWLELVRGEGPVTDIYVAMLERLHSERSIDVILTWSENGAVRRFARAHGISVLFGELGPTRPPFVPTMYFDPAGTNGHASYRKKIRKLIEGAAPDHFLPAATWLLASEIDTGQKETRASLVDVGLSYRTDESALLPDRPYVFVALQLADDLNTLLHSDFTSPLAFLRHVVQMAQDAGYAMVVKGHPGVNERPYNRRHELEALDWLKQNHPDAVILPRDCHPDLSAYVIANAAYTVSINSSASFEGMILGVPALILGQAAFDADGWLQENISLVRADQPRDFHRQINAIVSAHMEHVLVPKELALQEGYLAEQLQSLVEKRNHPLDHCNYSNWHVLGEHQQNGLEYSQKLPRRAALRELQIAFLSKVHFKGDQAIFRDTEQDLEHSVPLRDLYKGYIEQIDVNNEGNYVITGWLLEKDTKRPPLMVLLIENDTVIARENVHIMREDVQAAFSEVDGVLACGFQFSTPNSNISQLKLMFMSYDGAGQIISELVSGTAIGQTGPKAWLRKIMAKVLR